MSKFCCDRMATELEKECERHIDRSQCPDVLVGYLSKFNEYGILVHDGGSSIVEIQFCPWCGTKLPPSMRDRWLEELKEREIDPWTDAIPKEFQSDEWFSKL